MHRRPNETAHGLAQGIGWLSIGLGLAELLAPNRIAASLGMDSQADLVRAHGASKIASGIGILVARDPTPLIWGKVGGDMLDIATLAPSVQDNPKKGNVLLAIVALAGSAVLNVICARELGVERQELRRQERRRSLPDYRGRSGLPGGVPLARGAARDFEAPRDMRIPELLRPWAPANVPDAGQTVT